jgi:ABC-type polysaccharide/polyol phosphate transport system ATPase subunit
MSIIEVNHVSKEYQLGKLIGARQTAINALNRLRGRPPAERPIFKALNDVHFSVGPGEVVGIIGHNGAGKSTLLKILSRVSTPTSGSIAVRGKVAPLIEVGAGLNPEMTGRENIFLNATILGIPREEIRKKFDDIVSFAELEEFIDTPLKRYSSGMKVKLGFSIATSIEAEILIVDEVLAVGDLAFQRKCFDRMEELIKRQGKTVLVVSHNLRQVQRLSSRVILLDHGRILQDGEPEPTCNLFYELSEKQIQAKRIGSASKTRSSGEVDLLDIQLIDERGTPVDTVVYGSDATVRMQLQVNSPLTKPVVSVGVHTTDFLYLATRGGKIASLLEPGIHTVFCRIREFPFLPRPYSLRISISAGEYTTTVFYGENLKSFRVDYPGFNRVRGRDGFVEIDCDWWVGEPERAHEAVGLPEPARVLGL